MLSLSRHQRKTPVLLLTFIIAGITALLPLALLAQSEPAATSAMVSAPGPQVIIYADPDGEPGEPVPPPPSLARYYAQQAAAEVEGVTAVTAGNITVTFNNICTLGATNYNSPWPTNAKTSFQYAANIWNSLLLSSAPIAIDAQWCPFDTYYGQTTGILGGANATQIFANLNGSSCNGEPSNTWYAVATANLLCNTDIYAGYEISAKFNSQNTPWYFGTDGNPSSGTYDFASVVLHEIGHGLGFFGSMDFNNPYGEWGYSTNSGTIYPVIYDRYAETGSGVSLISYPNVSTTLGSLLLSNNIYFDATHSRAANNGSRVKLYAPSIWRPGSSYSHVDLIYDNTPHALMTYSLAPQEVQHNPGAITLGMFKDMYLKIETYPVLTGLPSTLLVLQNSTNNNILNLAALYSDADTTDANLNVNVQSSVAGAGVTFDGVYIDINPTTNFLGNTTVTVTVTDTAGLSVTDSFEVWVLSEINYTYLPAIMR